MRLNVTNLLRLVAWAVTVAGVSYAAELKPETIRAWQGYLQAGPGNLAERGLDSKHFLWVDQRPERYRQIRSGEVLVEPATEETPKHIASGLIHHWIGAVFIPDAKPADVLSVIRDYRDYGDLYKPGVAEAKLISSSRNEDRFTIRFVNSSVISRTSLLGTYVSRFVPVGNNRWYSVSEAVRMQEINDFGDDDERDFPPGHGSGFIWRLFSTSRFEERDGGTIMELEAIALSRDIPGAMRWIVDPIVRRVSRDSLEKSLNQTAKAVSAEIHNCARQASPPDSNQIMEACPSHASNSGLRRQELHGNALR